MMGAEQSSSRDQSGSSGNTPRPIKTCYYDLLGASRQASEDEIKKAYRKKALELHPDRNHTDVENATKNFAEIQSAYEILSDPQERAWYDSHRDAILRNDDDLGEEHLEHNVRLTSTGEIVKLIGLITGNIPFTDASNGFYGSLRQLFSNLAEEEAVADDCDGYNEVQYPGFGSADDSFEETVKPFYAAWTGFATRKTFSWLDEHRYTDAPDRRIRRLMEKENRRLREDGIKEFNNTVKSLVAFVRKRDPRYVPNANSEADRQRLLREATIAQAARSRAANTAKLDNIVIPEWSKTRDTGDESISDPETVEEEEYECVTCRKIFKSENQFEAHEKSKKHIRAVQQLKRQMQRENKLLNLNVQDRINKNASDSKLVNTTTSPGLDQGPNYLEHSLGTFIPPTSEHLPPVLQTVVSSAEGPEVFIDQKMIGDTPDSSNASVELDDEYAPRKDVEDRLFRLTVTSNPSLNSDYVRDTDAKEHKSATSTYLAIDHESETGHKAAMGKPRRAKKASRNSDPVSTYYSFRCKTCGQSYASKSKLFNHIKQLDHAQPISGPQKQK